MALQSNIQEDISNKELLEILYTQFNQQTQDIIAAFQGFANNTEERLQGLEHHNVITDKRLLGIETKVDHLQHHAILTDERLQFLESEAVKANQNLNQIITTLDIVVKDIKDLKEDQLSWKNNYQRYDTQLNDHEVRILHLEHS